MGTEPIAELRFINQNMLIRLPLHSWNSLFGTQPRSFAPKCGQVLCSDPNGSGISSRYLPNSRREFQTYK